MTGAVQTLYFNCLFICAILFMCISLSLAVLRVSAKMAPPSEYMEPAKITSSAVSFGDKKNPDVQDLGPYVISPCVCRGRGMSLLQYT